jgi:peptidoglycan/LPS O-acetylase OafA/YrhL
MSATEILSTTDVLGSFPRDLATTEVPAVRDGRLQFLDALRGIAATAVVLQHTLDYVSPSFREWSMNYLNLGQFGVVTFFLVSGFIIPVSLEKAGSLKEFWTSRFFRLFPIYWVSLLVIVLLAVAGRSELPSTFMHSFSRSVVANATMFQSFVGIPNALPRYWTLGMELVFYVLCSFLFLTNRLSKSLIWAWVAVAGMAALVLVDGLVFHRSLPAGRLGLMVTAFFGTVLYAIYAGRLKYRVLATLLPAVAVTLLVGFWFRFEVYPRSTDVTDLLSFSAVTTTWALAYVFFASLFLLRHYEFPKWMIWLGRISYSLYLMQGLILYVLPPLSNPVLVVAVNVGGSIGIAAITYPFIEKRFVALHKAHTRKSGAKQERVPALKRAA